MSRCTDNYASDQSSSVFTLSFLLRCFLPFLANFWVRVELTEHAHWWRIPCTRVWDFKTLDHNGKVPTARWLHTRIRDLLKKESESASHSVLSDSLQPHGLLPTRLLCPWSSPGKNTGVSSHSLLQGIFLTQGSNLDLPHCRQMLHPLSHQESPCWVKVHLTADFCSVASCCF